MEPLNEQERDAARAVGYGLLAEAITNCLNMDYDMSDKKGIIVDGLVLAVLTGMARFQSPFVGNDRAGALDRLRNAISISLKKEENMRMALAISQIKQRSSATHELHNVSEVLLRALRIDAKGGKTST